MIHAPTQFQLVLAAVLAAISVSAADAVADHPLVPLLADAKDGLQRIEDDVQDYTCLMIKRERVSGSVLPPEYLRLKVRHERVQDGEVQTPFSVYAKFVKSRDNKGRELIYVDGQNDNQMVVRKGGRYLPRLTFNLAPDAPLSMADNRYPVTDIGIQNLLRRLDLIGTCDLKHEECDVERTESAKEVDGRPCNLIEIRHPVRRPHFEYHLVRIFVDNEYQIPTRFEAFDWPDEEGGDPQLIEFYTYVDLKLNVGLTDEDFDPANEEYGFFISDLQPSPAEDVAETDSLASNPVTESTTSAASESTASESTASESTTGPVSSDVNSDQTTLSPAG